MKKLYAVLIDEAYIRDAQLIDTSELSDNEFANLDLGSVDVENLCRDIEPRHLVDIVKADNSDEAVQNAAKTHRCDARVLYAELIPRDENNNKITAYHMKMIFGVSTSITSLNEFLKHINEDNHPVQKNAFSVTVEQTIPFVPTQEILEKYAQAIKDSYTNKDFTVEDVQFLHYDVFEEVKRKENNPDEN